MRFDPRHPGAATTAHDQSNIQSEVCKAAVPIVQLERRERSRADASHANPWPKPVPIFCGQASPPHHSIAPKGPNELVLRELTVGHTSVRKDRN